MFRVHSVERMVSKKGKMLSEKAEIKVHFNFFFYSSEYINSMCSKDEFPSLKLHMYYIIHPCMLCCVHCVLFDTSYTCPVHSWCCSIIFGRESKKSAALNIWDCICLGCGIIWPTSPIFPRCSSVPLPPICLLIIACPPVSPFALRRKSLLLSALTTETLTASKMLQ